MTNAQKKFSYDPTLEALAGLFGGRLKTAEAVCEQYGKDESFHPSAPPHAVIQPQKRSGSSVDYENMQSP